ncbi:MAG: hypothetical protein K4571_01405 [Deltaproteobacteria bacterium]
MKPQDSVLKNINVLNVLLLTASVVMFFMLVLPLITTEVKVQIPPVKGKSAGQAEANIAEDVSLVLDYFTLNENKFPQPLLLAANRIKVPKTIDPTVKKEEKIAPGSVPTSLDFLVVAEKNLFHPDRRMTADKKEEQALVRPEILFYGAIITSDKRIAYIEDRKNPYSTPGRGKRQTPLAEGAMIGGYKLMEVDPETIVLVRGDDRMVVHLRDQKDRKSGDAAASAQVLSGERRAPSTLARPAGKTGSIPPPLPPGPAIHGR